MICQQGELVKIVEGLAHPEAPSPGYPYHPNDSQSCRRDETVSDEEAHVPVFNGGLAGRFHRGGKICEH